jgi:methyl-accepting chemotaxis protein
MTNEIAATKREQTRTVRSEMPIFASIASAIDEQSNAATHITRSIQAAAKNVARISPQVQSVEEATKTAGDSVPEIADCTDALSAHAGELELKASRFFKRVRVV